MKYTKEQVVVKYQNKLSQHEIEKLDYNLKAIKKYLKWKDRLDAIKFKYDINDFLNCLFTGEKLLTNTLSLEFYKQNYRTLDYERIHLDCKSLIIKKRGSQYDVENVSLKNGISMEEAQKKVENLKSRTSGTRENFIKRYGMENGEIKFREFAEKSKSTRENFKKRYGVNWEERWNSFLASRDSSSLKYWINKLGHEKGSLKFEQLKSEFAKSTKLEYYKQKYGESDGTKKYNDVNRTKSNTKEDMKLAGYTDNQIADISMRKSLIYCNLKNLYGEQSAKEMYEHYKETKINPFPTKLLEKNRRLKKFSRGPVSKAANTFFENLENELGRKLKYGKKSDELMLFDDVAGKAFFYDCLDIDTNTIIEYNGSAYHASEKLSLEERDEWCNPWGKTWEESRKIDDAKRNLAINKGYKFITVWDYETSGKKRTAIKIIELKEILCL